MCLKSNTKKADEIHDYFIKLEEILQEIINEESNELKNQLEQQKELIDELENKPETCGFFRKDGYIYIVRDSTKAGHYKIGFTGNPDKRISQLNTGSSTCSLRIITQFKVYDKEFAEKMIHLALQPFRIKHRNEWFYTKNDIELAYIINVVKSCINYIKLYDLTDYSKFKEISKKIDIDLELNEIKSDEQITEQRKEINNCINKKIVQQMRNKTNFYKGCCFAIEKQKWKAELKKDYKINFLGYYSCEEEAAKAYNDFAAFLNETENTEYALNDIPGYITKSRNVVKENEEKNAMKKTSYFNGVSCNNKRNTFVVSIKMDKKTYNLGVNKCEIECAKIYNQQALYFNNKYGTKFVLNDIPDYITLEKDIFTEIQENIALKKNKREETQKQNLLEKEAKQLLKNNRINS